MELGGRSITKVLVLPLPLYLCFPLYALSWCVLSVQYLGLVFFALQDNERDVSVSRMFICFDLLFSEALQKQKKTSKAPLIM
uniref:Uncharacterized protein n=1 Tax=Anopheles darlingi TaxID=43151 RepID=A0A2M4D7S5_ANODA